jgi:hypothetical protein
MSTLLSFPRRLKPCLAAAFALSCWFSLSAQAAEPIKVGLVAALSGQSAKSGEALTRGLTRSTPRAVCSGVRCNWCAAMTKATRPRGCWRRAS